MRKWKIKNKVYLMPKQWDKNKVLRWCNSSFRICEFCGKVDATMDHYKDCSPIREAYRQVSCYGTR